MSSKTSKLTRIRLYWAGLLLLLLPPAVAQQLTSLSAVYQGELLIAILHPYPKIQQAEFRLLKRDGTEVMSNTGFGYDLNSGRPMRSDVYYNKDQAVWVGILAVASDLASGTYLIEADTRTRRGWLILRSEVQIVEKKFKLYNLHLNKKMESLIQPTAPKANSESLERWNLIRKADLEMLFHSEHLEVPVKKARITSRFGERRRYIYPDGQRRSAIHKGHDLAAARGTPIYSSSAGKVILAKNRRVTGKTVIVAVLPGLFLQYQHLDQIKVRNGQWLQPSDLIGTVGTTGFSTGPHLHQELYVKGVQVDPSIYYDRPLLDKNLIMSMIGAIQRW